jgi:hypothetical protein
MNTLSEDDGTGLAHWREIASADPQIIASAVTRRKIP